MFICDEVRVEASPAAAAARLALLARGSSLTRASHAAWDLAITGAQSAPGPTAPRLVRVQSRGPEQQATMPTLILRWEAAAGNEQPFPVLDADITLAPRGDGAVLLGLAGVYRTTPGTRPDQPALRKTATVTARALLSRIADAISAPTAPLDGHLVLEHDMAGVVWRLRGHRR